MSILNDILSFNEEFVTNGVYKKYQTDKYPDKKMIVLTCMDTRLTELLPRAMNLRNGDAKIIKNAGALITSPFGSAMRSMLVGIYELNAKEIYVVGHHDCGMTSIQSDSILEKAQQRGISSDVLHTLTHAGINLEEWLKGFDNVFDSVRITVENIRKHPLIPTDITVHGLVIHPETGKLDLAADGYKG